MFSAVVFAVDSDMSEDKNDFIRDFSIIKKNNICLLKENFSDNSAKEITPGLLFRGKPDKHVNTHYKILAINSKTGYLKIESNKSIDLRSFGDKLKNNIGNFYVACK